MRAYFGSIGQHRLEIRFYLLYTLFANIGIGVFILIYNLYLVEIGLHEDFIGLFNALTTLAMAGIALVLGLLINRFGSWRCITYGTAFYLVASVVLAFLTNPTAILLFGAFSGIGSACVFVPVMPFIVEWTESENRARIAAVVFSVNSLSMTLGSLVGGWAPRLVSTLIDVDIVSATSYRFTLLIGLSLATVGLVPMWLMRHSRHGRPIDLGPAAFLTELPATKRQVRRDIMVFVMTGFVLSLGAGAIIPFFNVYLQSIGARPSWIGMIFAGAGIVAALTGLTAPGISRRLGPLLTILAVRLSPVPLYVLLALNPTLGAGILAHVVRTTSISMAWPIDSTFIAELLPPKARANAFSLRSGAWNIGFAVASLSAGRLIVSRGYDLTFLSFAFFSIISTTAFVIYFSRHPVVRSRRLTATQIVEPPV